MRSGRNSRPLPNWGADTVRTRISALAELADNIRRLDSPLDDRWARVHESFTSWASSPGLRDELRDHLRKLPAHLVETVLGRSRETTTHFAWCLMDERADPFSFWLHEYKPKRDWRPGYADSVHNHRYHFCTTILRGSYLHERFDAELDVGQQTIRDVTPLRRTVCGMGDTGILMADEFHRIPMAADDTMTFLVKSRPVTTWSLSFDPISRISRRHVPVETRITQLAERL
jgi:hypothetical protein